MQTKTKIISLGLIAVILCVAFLSLAPITGYAEESSVAAKGDEFANNDNAAEPYALFVDVAVALNGDNGEVWAAAQTKAAIFATTIYVVLELYSSDTYQDSYTNMKLEGRVHSQNLKKGEIIKVVIPTNGKEMYLRGRMYYKADSADWKYVETSTELFDANGIIIK